MCVSKLECHKCESQSQIKILVDRWIPVKFHSNHSFWVTVCKVRSFKRRIALIITMIIQVTNFLLCVIALRQIQFTAHLIAVTTQMFDNGWLQTNLDEKLLCQSYLHYLIHCAQCHPQILPISHLFLLPLPWKPTCVMGFLQPANVMKNDNYAVVLSWLYSSSRKMEQTQSKTRSIASTVT